MTSSNGNIFRVTGPLWGESTGHRWIPLTKASNAERWCFLWCAPQQTAEQTVDMLVIWDAMSLIMASLKWFISSIQELIMQGMQQKYKSPAFDVKRIVGMLNLNIFYSLPKCLIIIVPRFRYINNNATKYRCSIPMSMTIVLGLDKFSL